MSPAPSRGTARRPDGPSDDLLRELTAVSLITVGSVLLPLLGWVAGVVLLWSSRVWSPAEKLLGTLVVPGGLLTVFFLAFVPSFGERGWVPPFPLGLLSLLVLAVAPVLMAVVLLQRARARAAGTPPALYGRHAPDLAHRVAVPVLLAVVGLSLALPVAASVT